MNTGGARSRNGRRRVRLPRRLQRRRPAQPIVVVSGPNQIRRRRRRRGNSSRRGANAAPGRGGSRETFVFTKDDLAGNTSGSLTFGPSLSECPAFATGILKAYHEYRISQCTLEFISEAPSTASGSIAYELDAHCKISSLSSKINKFGITKGGKRSFAASKINGIEWHDSSEDQFRLLYKGNGASNIAGSFRVTIVVATQNPK